MRKLNSTLCLPRRGWPPLPNELFLDEHNKRVALGEAARATTLRRARQNMAKFLL